MPIHEKSLFTAGDLLTHDKLVVDGVDVSGHWNTMMKPRYVSDYDADLQKAIQAYPGGENVHRCWQCGSCTNACTMYALNAEFNPRYWIYLVNLGLKEELLKDRDIIWQCVSCNKCTDICPKDVRPEGVMKALQHWMEDEGHVAISPSTLFDGEFTRQCFERGRIEDTEVIANFFRRTGQSIVELLRSGWLGIMIARMNKWPLLGRAGLATFLKRMPVLGPLKMGLMMIFKPRTRNWARSGEVLRQYVDEQKRLRKARA